MKKPNAPIKDYYLGKLETKEGTRLFIVRRRIKKGKYLNTLVPEVEKKTRPYGMVPAPKNHVRLSKYVKTRDEARAEMRKRR